MSDGKSKSNTKCNIHRHYSEKGLEIGDFESALSSETLNPPDKMQRTPYKRAGSKMAIAAAMNGVRVRLIARVVDGMSRTISHQTQS
ncbi:MAG TPA: hypothetical protein VMG82_28710 [Candidatus Sulfotelmatobacter sp.]|nr:hypothetical protein [Candidatus Sulfotelmatobacter sp.]